MSFLNMGLLGFLLGAAAIAGVLFLLQRLRVRYQQREVVTTLFWKQAVEETRARVLVRRFRHPLAYLLFLLIGGLIWLALAEPQWGGGRQKDTVFLLDGSAGMGWGERFEQARSLLAREVDRVPPDRRRVYFCGADARLVLNRGEETWLLGPRLEELSPEPAPSRMERELMALSQEMAADVDLEVFVVGDAPVNQAVLDLMPEGFTVKRLRGEAAPELEGNATLAALGVAEARSGTYDMVDVMVRVEGNTEPQFALLLGDRPLVRDMVREGDLFYLRDLPARGEVLEVVLAGDDSLPEDNRARILLPSRQPIRVALDEGVDARFRTLVDIDPALREVAGGEAPQVQVTVDAAPSGPAIRVVPGNSLTVIYPTGMGPDELERSQATFGGTGLDRVGRTLITAGSGDRSFQLVPNYVAGNSRGIQLGADLMTPDYDFVQSSAFPLFVSEAIRWLANAVELEPFAVAGEPLTDERMLAMAGSGFTPPRAGDYLASDGRRLEVALGAWNTAGATLETVTRSREGGAWPGWVTLCALLALLLVGADWWLYQKGRIP